jgi:site-specific recombinase XerD
MPTSLERFAVFLEQAERSPLTIKNYLSDLRAFAAWFEETNGDSFEPAKITPTDLREYKRWMVSHCGFKPNSVNRKLATLKSFIHWATETGLVADARALKIPKAEREECHGPRWLDRREQNKLLRVAERADQPRDLALIKLLLNTGLRVQELCDLTWRDVTLTERKGTLTVRSGKGGKRRQVPLNQSARSALLAMEYQEHAGKRTHIFVGQRGPLTPRGVQNLLSKYAATGLEDVSPHTLRHTFCKNLVDAGVGLEKVAALAGHESLETTRRYCEPSLKDLERVVELIGEEE